jgi:putative aldouronate transport system permease protein
MYMTVLCKSFESIPPSLEESAKIDGANDITILFRIVLPLSMPILATFTLYYIVDRWNEWWFGMLYMKSPANQPLQLIVRSIVQGVSTMSEGSAASASQMFGEGIKMASTVISMLPIMLAYPFLQRFFISGLVVGAVKE